MFARLFISLSLAAALIARGESIVSQSRQFVVHYGGAKFPVEKLPTGATEVVPELLVVTAERVKNAVASEIPALGSPRTQIHLGVLNAGGADSLVTIASSRFADAWRYEVAIPRVVEEARLVKGLINVLLLEFANRGADRNAELPAWLTEGLAEELQFTVGPKLVVGRAPTAWEASAHDLHHWTRAMLRTNASPTFQDVTTASVPPRNSSAEKLYIASTHLLVHSLLEMPNGRENFAKFLQLLPRTWNWQTAFLQAFGFQRMLDVEKWWSLTLVEFTTRDQRQAWNTELSLRKLDDLLLTRVEVRNATNALPEMRSINLTSVINETDSRLQRDAINDKITQLGLTAPHMAPQVGALALAYKAELETFLKKRAGSGVRTTLRSTPEAQKKAAIFETIRRCSALDQKRRALADVTVTAR